MVLPGLEPTAERQPPSSSDFDLVATSFEQAAQSASARIPHGMQKSAQG
jgi:hypothetical protein